MLITTLQELQNIYPTSKWDRIETIMPTFVRTEVTYLRQYVGDDLLAKLNEDYGDIKGANGGLGTTYQDDSSAEDKRILIIQACQEVIVLKTFADNTNMLSSVLNRGGGFNLATAQNFDSMDEKRLADLSKEFFFNSQKALEHLMLLLEDDAKLDIKPSDPDDVVEGKQYSQYREYWQKCAYFHFHQDLFFSSAAMMQSFYNLENKRTTYNQLIPNIGSCQALFVASHLGMDLMRQLLKVANGNDSDISKVMEHYEIEPDYQTVVKDVLNSSIYNIRHALAQYIKASLATKPSEGAHYTTRGDHHINLAIKEMLAVADMMPKVITSSLLNNDYKQLNGKTYEEAHKPAEDKCHRACKDKKNNDYILNLT